MQETIIKVSPNYFADKFSRTNIFGHIIAESPRLWSR